MKTRASSILGKHTTTKLHLGLQYTYFVKKIPKVFHFPCLKSKNLKNELHSSPKHFLTNMAIMHTSPFR